MKEYYYIEGHKGKTSYEFEDTLVLDDTRAYASEEKVITKSEEYFEKDENLGLIVIYKGLKLGDRVAIKYMFRNKDGKLDLVDSWWNDTRC